MKEGKEGRGRKEEKRGKNGEDRSVAMRFLIASQAKRGDTKIQTFLRTCSLNESKIAASSALRNIRGWNRIERKGKERFFFLFRGLRFRVVGVRVKLEKFSTGI